MLMAQELQYAMSTPELTDEALGNEIYLAMQEMMVPVIEMFAGTPSITPPIAYPCDSPKVVILKILPNDDPAIT